MQIDGDCLSRFWLAPPGDLKVMVVCAHPDDETLGMGGTLSLHARRGDDITLVVLTEGASARYATKRKAGGAILRHKNNTKRAASTLGVSRVSFADFPDMGLDTVPVLKVCRFVEAQVARFKPEILYATHKGDLNRDHRIAFEASAVATRPAKRPLVRKVLSFEVPSSTEWIPVTSSEPFRPNVFVNISTTMKTKLKALSAYDTELRDYPHPRSAEAVEARAKYWGICSGLELAEPFELIRENVGPNIAA